MVLSGQFLSSFLRAQGLHFFISVRPPVRTILDCQSLPKSLILGLRLAVVDSSSNLKRVGGVNQPSLTKHSHSICLQFRVTQFLKSLLDMISKIVAADWPRFMVHPV